MVDIAKKHTTPVVGTAHVRTGGTVPAADPALRHVSARNRTILVGEHRLIAEPRSATAARCTLAGIRMMLGFIFLWAFLDKMFGLGFATASAKSWLNSGNPTAGFLGSSKGPFSGFFHAIAGTTFANVMFMGGLLAIGTALILGIGMRLAAAGGALLTVMMWAAILPPTSNPIMDDHLIYAAGLIVLALLDAGNTAGLGRPWASTALVQRAPWLK
jgi:thiosulfate dehydrogenase [quinone] large subunit